VRNEKGMVDDCGRALVAMILSCSAQAQSYVRERIQTQVPVNFVVAKTMLPSGAYTFWVDTTEDRVQIVQDSTDKSIFVFGMQAAPSTNGRYNVTFTKAGETYQLAEINGRDFAVEFVRQKGVPYSPFNGTIEGIPTGGGKATTGTATK
jgi:hypothetical protein